MFKLQGSMSKGGMPRGGYWFVIVWAAGMIVVYGLGGYFGVKQLQGYKAESREYRQAWMKTFTAAGQGTRAPEVGASGGAKPADVHVGLSLNRISDIELRQANWTADFDIWFRWKGKSMNPGRNLQIVNGTILEKKKVRARIKNGVRYEQYRVRARMSNAFDAARFPFSSEGLAIAVTDEVDGADVFRYVADGRGIDISHLAVPQHLKITRDLAVVGLQHYASGEGGADGSAGTDTVHSVFVAGLLIRPPSVSLYLKLFQALFASVAITLIVFFIRPIHVDPRFGLAVGAFFAAVGNNIYVITLLPPSERISLANMINGIGLATIFLALAQSAVSLYILDTMGRERLSRVFDMVSFAALFIGYAALNLVLPLAAGS